MRPNWTTGVVVAAIGLVVFSTATARSSSTSYVLEPTTVNSGGEASTSASFRMVFSLGQGTSVGSSSAPGHVLQAGFWSFLGSGPVPIVLAVDQGMVSKEAAVLDWSGNEAPYEIYAATDCANVFDSFHVTSAGNSYTVLAPAAELVCFNVISMGALPPSRPLP